MTSLVLLTDSHIALTLELLLKHLDELFPGEFLPPKESGNFAVDGPVKDATYMIKVNITGYSGGYMLHSVPAPYTGYSDFDKYISDPELAAIVSKHRCWLSVDSVFPHGTTDEHYRFIGTLLSHLAPDDSLAVVHPSKLLTIAFDSDVRRQLSLDGFTCIH